MPRRYSDIPIWTFVLIGAVGAIAVYLTVAMFQFTRDAANDARQARICACEVTAK